jgi:hypothetical protein
LLGYLKQGVTMRHLSLAIAITLTLAGCSAESIDDPGAGPVDGSTTFDHTGSTPAAAESSVAATSGALSSSKNETVATDLSKAWSGRCFRACMKGAGRSPTDGDVDFCWYSCY